jgi:predicted hotdog family 3-hydroxylacyl-ACP dehydratase
MLINKDSITKYIPQRFPFVMVDNLLSADETQFESTFEINSDNLFLKDGELSESALVENIAQTCAAGFGYVGSLKGEGAGKLGFIGSVTRLEVKKNAQLNDVISTKVNVLSTFDTIHLIEGVASSNGEELLSCQMKIVVG